MRSTEDIIDLRLRVTRAENPFLFKALAALDARPGIGLRNGLVKQLAEVGLIVHEERLRRESGLSTRAAGRLADALGDHLSGGEPGRATASNLPTAAPAASPAEAPVATSNAERGAVDQAPHMPQPRTDAPAVAPAEAVRADTASSHPDSRSPSRVSGSGPRRVLGGYASD